MAAGKKIVNVYVEWGDLFEKLEDDEAGRLIKHFFRYIGDKNPEAPDRLTDIAFEPMKKQLQRDLKKWEAVCDRNRKNIAERWKNKNEEIPIDTKNTTGIKTVPTDTKNTDKEEVEEEEEVKDEKNIKFSFKKSLMGLGVSDQTASDWLKAREKKKAANTLTAFNLLKEQIELSGLPAEECIKTAIARNWQSFRANWVDNQQYKSKNNGQNKQQYNGNDQQGAERKAAIMREAAEACAAAGNMCTE